MPHSIKKLLLDLKISCEEIQEFSKEKSFEEFCDDRLLQLGLEREFEIIGEAMSRIDKIDPEIKISSKKQIISMRNRVIHGYDKIDDEIVWGTIIRHLPVLKTEVSKLMN